MNIFYLLICAACALAASAALIFCLVRGSGAERKKLLYTVLLLGAVTLLRFGGGAVLSRMGMGWRLAPRYGMDFAFGVLLMVTAYRCGRALSLLEGSCSAHPAAYWASRLALTAVLFLVPFFMFVLSIDNLSEKVEVRNGQTLVWEYKINGGAVFYCYAPVNSLIHGAELDYDWDWRL